MDSNWLSPQKLLDNYIGWVVADIHEAKKQLFLAVVYGDVRARCLGNILDPRWFKQFGADDDDRYALPPDVEVSVEDAKRRWSGKSA